MFTTSTELGRRVLIDDWLSLHRDRLLAVLYQLRDLGGEDNGMTIKQVSDVLGLDDARTRELLRSMKGGKPKLATVSWPSSGEVDFRFVSDTSLTNLVVNITARGVRWVEESPRSPARDALPAVH